MRNTSIHVERRTGSTSLPCSATRRSRSSKYGRIARANVRSVGTHSGVCPSKHSNWQPYSEFANRVVAACATAVTKGTMVSAGSDGSDFANTWSGKGPSCHTQVRNDRGSSHAVPSIHCCPSGPREKPAGHHRPSRPAWRILSMSTTLQRSTAFVWSRSRMNVVTRSPTPDEASRAHSERRCFDGERLSQLLSVLVDPQS